MKLPTPDLLRRLAEAARMRAAGISWDTIAHQVGRTIATCQHWPRQYPELWQRESAAARARLRDDCAAEAMTTLRSLLRSENEAIRRDAGKLLLSLAPGPTGAAVDDTGRIEEHLLSLSHAELEHLAAAVTASDLVAAGRADEAGGGTGAE